MKRAKLEAVLRRKIRLKITKRKRGVFMVVIPPELNFGLTNYKSFSTKKEALIFLFIQLRCLSEIVIEVKVS